MNEHINTQSMLPVGTLLQGGKYRIERYLSSGGFGNTYVATNTMFQEQVALKEFFMRGISDRDGDSVSVSVSNRTNVEQFDQQKNKFCKEARRLRKLRNDHIVSVHDLFEENGTAYYEMDLIKGESLAERLKRTGKPLTEPEAVKILRHVLAALKEVHEQGLYHLDLKPANIMINEKGDALLIDFGASKQMHNYDGQDVSVSSALACTVGYAPLEQTEQNTSKFGPWTDLYALGATLYKLVTDQTPPSATELIMDSEPMQFPATVSPRLQELITWMMKPRINERPKNVDDVLRFLEPSEEIFDESIEPIVEEKTELVKPQLQTKDEETEMVERPKQQPAKVTAASSVKPSATSTAEAEEPAEEKKSHTLLYAGIGAAVVIGIIIAVVVLLPGNNKKDATLSEQVAASVSAPKTVTDLNYTSTVKNGMGTYTYTGPVDEENRPHGTGKALLKNGDRYEGRFQHGVMEGEGAKYFFKEGDTFEGEMKNDAFANGTYTFKEDGSSFKGTFADGQPAHGKWYDKNGKQYDEI